MINFMVKTMMMMMMMGMTRGRGNIRAHLRPKYHGNDHDDDEEHDEDHDNDDGGDTRQYQGTPATKNETNGPRAVTVGGGALYLFSSVKLLNSRTVYFTVRLYIHWGHSGRRI